ncbi:histamine H3 receptor-like [Amia ocellicauda]|uniref:histamine H3 receptor-like n=1 Tax=Amia ocellicauda TaxID=2972642 RepID=UPI00346452CF
MDVFPDIMDVKNGTEAFGKHAHVQDRRYPVLCTILLLFLVALLVVVTVLGNALVMLAFVVEKSLRTQSNFFLLNLAISDFLVGAFCMPLYVPYLLTGRWSFEKSLCRLWLVMDYLMCTSSVFNIVLISYDRFLSVTRPVAYRTQQGKVSQAVAKMALVWFLAFLLYGPAIIAWEHIAGHSIVGNEQCYPEFYFNWYFLITASTVEFFMPFISVTFFNVSIYLSIRCRARSRKKLVKEMTGGPTVQGRGATLDHLLKAVVMVVGLEGQTHLIKPSAETPSAPDTRECAAGETTQTPACSENHVETFSPTSAQQSRLQRDKKVAKSLAIIVCTFGVCWAPYTLLMIIRAACNGQCVPTYCYEVSFWLLWLNSAINPFLYPLCHKTFRKAFKKMLCSMKFNSF